MSKKGLDMKEIIGTAQAMVQQEKSGLAPLREHRLIVKTSQLSSGFITELSDNGVIVASCDGFEASQEMMRYIFGKYDARVISYERVVPKDLLKSESPEDFKALFEK